MTATTAVHVHARCTWHESHSLLYVKKVEKSTSLNLKFFPKRFYSLNFSVILQNKKRELGQKTQKVQEKVGESCKRALTASVGEMRLCGGSRNQIICQSIHDGSTSALSRYLVGQEIDSNSGIALTPAINGHAFPSACDSETVVPHRGR